MGGAGARVVAPPLGPPRRGHKGLKKPAEAQVELQLLGDNSKMLFRVRLIALMVLLRHVDASFNSRVCLSMSSSSTLLNLDFGLVAVRGPDRLRLLHGLGTQSFEDAKAGDVFSTCFLDASGKVLDHVRCWVTESDVKLLCEADSSGLSAFLQRFIFPFDRVEVVDETATKSVSLLFGPGLTSETIEKWLSVPEATLRDANLAQKAVELDCGSVLLPGNDLVPAPSEKPEKGATSTDRVGELQGFTIIGPVGNPLPSPHFQCERLGGSAALAKWHELRRSTGRPSVVQDARPFNASALELGLMHTMHFRKGCYVGNEVVSKQVATKAVRRRLVGLLVSSLEGAEGLAGLDSGTELIEGKDETNVVGVITSAALYPGGMALALVKAKLLDELAEGRRAGLVLSAKNRTTQLFKPVFLPYSRYDAIQSSRAPPLEKLKTQGQKVVVPEIVGGSSDGGSDETSEEKRKREKLAAMAAKVAALQAKKAAAS